MTVQIIDPTKGIYKHVETGFTVHDVFSINDVITCNGALACTDDSAWAWVAGRDLVHEIQRSGSNSLTSLARNILRKWDIISQGCKYSAAGGVEYGSQNSVAYVSPGLVSVPSSDSNIRIFGICTNAAAGRGCSRDRFGRPDGTDYRRVEWCGAWYRFADAAQADVSYTPANMPVVDFDVAANFDTSFIGRAIVAIPLPNWALLRQNWAASLENKDKDEVQAAASRALAAVPEATLIAKFGACPVIYLPIALYSDGTAAVERSVSPFTCCVSTSGKRNNLFSHSPWMQPSVPDLKTGWTVTNPVGFGNIGVNVPRVYGEQGSSTIDSLFVATDIAALANYTMPRWTCGKVAGIELFKMLGGLYPRTGGAFANIDIAGTSIVDELYRGMYYDAPSPTQRVGETAADYATRLRQAYDDGVYDLLDMIPSTWVTIGQPALIATWLLNAGLNEGGFKMTKACASALLTGYYSATARQSAAAGTVTKVVGSISREIVGIDEIRAYFEV